MATIADLQRADGFTVESPDGVLGRVEETRSETDALVVRTPDGGRALLPAEAVTSVDPDLQEVFVPAGTKLTALETPRAEDESDWVSRTAPAKRERPLWLIVGFAFAMLSALIAAEIGADFLIAYLVTGNPPY